MVLAEPTPLDLGAPSELDGVLRHDPTFVAWDRGLSTARDVVNHGIRTVNQVGAGLPELPEGSLEELLVVPLTGDHQEIRRNAEGCRQVEQGLVTWAGSLARLAAAVTDIVDDIRHVLSLVETLLELQDTVTERIAEQRPRLLRLRGLPELVGASA